MRDTFGILLYENVQPMDVLGPWEVLGTWKNLLNAPITLHLISEKDSFIQCDNDIVLKSHYQFENCPTVDYLIVPGGRGRLKEVHNPKMIEFIQKQAVHCKYILSVCTGAFLLHQAGLLDNQKATTYWRALPELRSHAEVTVVEQRIVKSANIWSSGGVSSGIDLALELIAEIAGKATAGKVQLLFEYFPRNSVFCNKETAETLPEYYTNKDNQISLPEYIRDYLASAK